MQYCVHVGESVFLAVHPLPPPRLDEASINHAVNSVAQRVIRIPPFNTEYTCGLRIGVVKRLTDDVKRHMHVDRRHTGVECPKPNPK